MPAIIAALGAVLIQLLRIYLVSIIGRVLLTIGVGIFAYKVAVPQLMDFVGNQFSALPEFVRASVGRAGIDVMATMVLSALAVRQTARVFFGRAGGE